ncbi:MAG: zf-HC2 domain-containing protein [Lachnospiraceae bacterium]|nr:zf-HC2 domain-containing protein [Lachnospiraceae bacterium]
MDCKRAQALVPRYIRQEIDGEEMEAFLGHVKHCGECYEELEIYYTIDTALKELDGNLSSPRTLKMSMEQALLGSERKVRNRRCLQVSYYVLNTVVFWVVTTAFVLLLRMYLGII